MGVMKGKRGVANETRGTVRRRTRGTMTVTIRKTMRGTLRWEKEDQQKG